jgi:NAD+ kinase
MSHTPIQSVGIVYLQTNPAASALAETLPLRLREGERRVWSRPSRGAGDLEAQLAGTELVLVLGGDGSILSVARACAQMGVPILGINFGRVGFLSELEPAEVDAQLPHYLDGDYWIDERSMLRAAVEVGGAHHHFAALNDIVLARGAEPRVIRIKVWLDGHIYNTTVADGIIISTATGSTAYNLAAGGPILYPQVRSNVLTPIAPHLVADRSLVLEPGATVTLEVQPGSDNAVLSADGQLNLTIAPGVQVTVGTNEHVTRFLRRRPPTHFYRILSAKLRDAL